MAQINIEAAESVGYRNRFSVELRTDQDLTAEEMSTIYSAIDSIANTMKPRFESERIMQEARKEANKENEED